MPDETKAILDVFSSSLTAARIKLKPADEELLQYFEKNLTSLQALALIAKQGNRKRPDKDIDLGKSTPFSTIVWDDNVNWHDDKRLELYEVLSYFKEDDGIEIARQLRDNLNSVVLIAHQDVITNKGEIENKLTRTVTLRSKALRHLGIMEKDAADKDTKFKIHPAFPYSYQESIYSKFHFGTGFFVSKNIVFTAAHIFDEPLGKCKDELVIIRGYYMKDGESLNEIDQAAVYKIKGKITQNKKIDSGRDWACFEVERKFKDSQADNGFAHTSFQEKKLINGEEVYMIGHGMGLPLKMSWNGLVFITSEGNEDIARAKLESFKGNSGGPVFSAETHQVVGIVKGGTGDVWYQRIQEGAEVYALPVAFLHGYFGLRFTKIASLPRDIRSLRKWIRHT